MANKSGEKGTRFEYKIRDILTDHFKIKFERVPASGALAYLKGDLWSPDNPQFSWVVECKHYEELDFNSLLTAKSNDIFSFWQQALDNAKPMKKKPLLIFKWNFGKNMVAWNEETINLKNQLIVDSFGYTFKIGLLDDWLKTYGTKIN